MSDKPSRMAGETITLENGALLVPNNPTIHYIEGDGIGVDISPVMIKVVDAAVAKAYIVKNKFIGAKSWPERRPSTLQVNGYQRLP